MASLVWTNERLARLVHLRDDLELKWDVIAQQFGVKGPICCTRYHRYKSTLRIAARRKELGLPPPKPGRAPVEDAPIPPSPIIAASLAATVKRPRYFSDADRFVMDRIELQGVTAGFCGDPLPGRSALDQREGRK